MYVSIYTFKRETYKSNYPSSFSIQDFDSFDTTLKANHTRQKSNGTISNLLTSKKETFHLEKETLHGLRFIWKRPFLATCEFLLYLFLEKNDR
jgi:hypothetical protein